MSRIDFLNEFEQGKGADATKVNQNFSTVKTAVNNTVDEVDELDSKLNVIETKVNRIVSSIFLGQLVFLTTNFFPTGVLPCNGSEYSRSVFPSFFRDYLLSGKINTCSYEVYEQEITEYGYCGKFALDAINNRFKTPFLSGDVFLGATTIPSDAGKAFKQGLPNLTGSFRISQGNFPTREHTGVFGHLRVS